MYMRITSGPKMQMFNIKRSLKILNEEAQFNTPSCTTKEEVEWAELQKKSNEITDQTSPVSQTTEQTNPTGLRNKVQLVKLQNTQVQLVKLWNKQVQSVTVQNKSPMSQMCISLVIMNNLK